MDIRVREIVTVTETVRRLSSLLPTALKVDADGDPPLIFDLGKKSAARRSKVIIASDKQTVVGVRVSLTQ